MIKKISIVTAYYNRKKTLWRTLKSIEKSTYKNFEFIIIDDASDPSQRIEDFVEEFNFIRLVRIKPEDKHHMNPCIPFNMGFSLITGNIVIIQAPECLHVGDVLDFVANNSKNNQYLVFSCYSLGKEVDTKLNSIDYNLPLAEFKHSITSAIGNFSNKGCEEGGRYDSWFIHPIYRPAQLNFLSSIMTKDLWSLGGFNERFANGYAFEDSEFVERINKKKMDVKLIKEPFCIHSFHSPADQDIANLYSKELKNKKLYMECAKSSNYKIENSFLNK